MDYFVSIEKGVTMKVSKKVLLLTAIMGMTWGICHGWCSV